MPSFQISDPPASAQLNELAEEGKAIARGTVRFSVENTTPTRRTASVKVVPDKPDDAASYVVTGSSKTLPTVSTVDFGANESRTIEVEITVPRGSAPANGAFRLRVQKDSEDNDEDSIDSRPVAYEVAAVATPAPPPRPFPWLALVAALALVAIVGGVAAYLLWPKGTSLEEVRTAAIGHTPAEAETALAGKNLVLVPVVRRKDDAEPVGSVNDVAVDTSRSNQFYLYYDPGLASLVGQQVTAARQVVAEQWKLQSSDKPTSTDLDANVVAAADVTGPDTAQVIALSYDPGFAMDSLVEQSTAKMVEVFNTLTGKATATILSSTDDPDLCKGRTRITSQQPLNASNAYKTGTQFFFRIRVGTRVDRFLCRPPTRPWVLENELSQAPNIRFQLNQ